MSAATTVAAETNEVLALQVCMSALDKLSKKSVASVLRMLSGRYRQGVAIGPSAGITSLIENQIKAVHAPRTSRKSFKPLAEKELQVRIRDANKAIAEKSALIGGALPVTDELILSRDNLFRERAAIRGRVSIQNSTETPTPQAEVSVKLGKTGIPYSSSGSPIP